MIKSKQIAGLGIVELEHGKIIGKVNSTIFSPGVKKIHGFCVDCGKWVKKQKILIPGDILSIGRDSVMVKYDDALRDYSDYPDFSEVMNERNRVFGLIVMTNSGEELGYIEDIILDEKWYTIEGYVLTDGIVEDVLRGKSIIPFEEEMIFGEDTVIINNNCRNVILKNDIYLKRVFKKGRRLRY